MPKGSWRTTAAGATVIIAALLNLAVALWDDDKTTKPDVAGAAVAIVGGLGLIFARDNGVTSEDAGATGVKP